VTLRVTLAVPVAALALLAVAAAGCSSDDSSSGPSGSGSGSSQEHGHGGSGTYGSSMAPENVSVADVADLGPGPQVGRTFTGTIGLNVCGRFLEPPVPAGPPVGGVSTDGKGHYTAAPTTAAEAGHAATVGDLLQQVGITMATGSLTLPASTTPATIEEPGLFLPVAGATLTTGQTCGKLPAQVQLWLYTKDAADTGRNVRQVVTDPQNTPIAADGMVFVVAFSPESSLPTLPPSALAG
jgi:hypothetical protein